MDENMKTLSLQGVYNKLLALKKALRIAGQHPHPKSQLWQDDYKAVDNQIMTLESYRRGGVSRLQLIQLIMNHFPKNAICRHQLERTLLPLQQDQNNKNSDLKKVIFFKGQGDNQGDSQNGGKSGKGGKKYKYKGFWEFVAMESDKPTYPPRKGLPMLNQITT